MGPERALSGYRNFIRTWSEGRDHPALQDFVAAMRPYARDPAAFDAFTAQWFQDRVVPEYRVVRARKAKAEAGYDVTVTVRNIGTGTMPVEIAATAGERWAKAGTSGSPASGAAPSYHEARGTVTLAAGESKNLTIHCGFEPGRVVVDPDVRILQLRRKLATTTL
jgi:hypothetical protein